jgi:phosphoribosylanthranilate isomerase
MKIKICGVSSLDTIPILNEVKPDYVGFVFAKSKRQVTLAQAKALRAALDPSIPTVGVFVNADFDFIKRSVDEGAISLVQLHGQEDQAMIDKVKALGVLVIKAVSYEEITSYNNIDYLLVDNKVAGSGQSYDYSKVQVNRPYILAGGLNSDTIDEALKTNAEILDLSSGVETDGKKDPEKIREIVRRVHHE